MKCYEQKSTLMAITLSFDVDGLDPIDAPSTGTAASDCVRILEAVELDAAGVREPASARSMWWM